MGTNVFLPLDDLQLTGRQDKWLVPFQQKTDSRAIPQGNALKRPLLCWGLPGRRCLLQVRRSLAEFGVVQGDCEPSAAAAKEALSSVAREGAELGLEFTACCHLTFVPVSMALFCGSSLHRFTDQFPPGLTGSCRCNCAVRGEMPDSAQLVEVAGVHTPC